MKSVRRLGLLLCLAFALAIGQQAALQHELGHTFQRLDASTHTPQLPATDTCEKCGAYSALHGGLLGAAPGLLVAALSESFHAFSLIPAPRRTVVAIFSTGPPRFS
jgi:hypothetical protein